MNTRLVRRIIFPLHERLKGKRTLACLKELERTQWMSRMELDARRIDHLRRFLRHAYESVPYYRTLFDAAAFNPARVQDLSDIKAIPFLTKDAIRKNLEALRSQAYNGRMVQASTGGSTGEPVTVYWDANRLSWDTAAQLRSHRWFGIEVGEKEAVLWGSPIEAKKQDRLRELRDHLIHTKLLSAFNLSEASFRSYLATLKRWRPVKIYGYVSVLHLFAKFLLAEDQRSPIDSLKGIFVTAEPLYDFQRAAIEYAFGCSVAIEYGSREAGAVAHQCPTGGVHINAEQVMLELINERGEAGPGEQGEIVLTVMSALGMPLIRYRTADIATARFDDCPCGRSLPVIGAIEGRSTDFLLKTDGALAHALSAIYIMRGLKKVKQFRVVQEAVDLLWIDVAADEPLAEGEISGIRLQMKKLLGDPVRVEIRQTREIPPLPSGKHRYVISKVAPAAVG